MLKTSVEKLTGTMSLTVMNQLTIYGANFIVFFIIARSFNSEQLGIWAMYLTIISLSEHVRQGLFHQSTIRLSKGYNYSKSSIMWHFILLNLLYLIVSNLLIVLLNEGLQFIWGSSELNQLIRFSFCGSFSMAFLQILNTYALSRQKLKFQLKVNFIYSSLNVAGISLLSNANYFDAWSIIAFQFLLGLFISPILIRKIFKGVQRFYFDRDLVKDILNFGKYNAGGNLLSILFQKSDLIILSLFTNHSIIGLYHFASKIVNYSELFMNALSQYFYPKMSKEFFNQKAGIHKTFNHGLFFMLVSIIPLIVLFQSIPNYIIEFIGGEKYLAAKSTITILLLASLIKPVGRMFGIFLDSINRPDINFKMLLLSLFCNIFLNFLLIPLFGLIGAATATTISVILTIASGHLFNIHLIREFQLYTKFNFNLK